MRLARSSARRAALAPASIVAPRDDAVAGFRGRRSDVALGEIGGHQGRIPIEGVAEAAAPRTLHDEEIVGKHGEAADLAREA